MYPSTERSPVPISNREREPVHLGVAAFISTVRRRAVTPTSQTTPPPLVSVPPSYFTIWSAAYPDGTPAVIKFRKAQTADGDVKAIHNVK